MLTLSNPHVTLLIEIIKEKCPDGEGLKKNPDGQDLNESLVESHEETKVPVQETQRAA